MNSQENPTTLFIAPGQGGQRPNLIELARQIPEVQETYDYADRIGIQIFGADNVQGRSISEWATVGTNEDFNDNTAITQPLIVATTIGLIKYLKKQEKATTMYGHSLGELAALYGVGSLTEENALMLAMLRGVYCAEANADKSGIMAALLNVPHEFISMIKFGESEEVEISTDNSPNQITISGRKEKVLEIVRQVRDRYQKVQGLSKEEKRQLPNAVVLKINGAFHSFLMKPAQKAYSELLAETELVIPNTANFFSNHTHAYEASPDNIRHGLVEQLIKPVKFWLDIGKLIADGHVRIIEIGPGRPLSPELLVQQSLGNLPSNLQIMSVEKDMLALAG